MSVLLALAVLTVIAAVGAHVGTILLGIASSSLLQFALFTVLLVGGVNILEALVDIRSAEDGDYPNGFIASIFLGAVFARMAYLVTLSSL